MLTLTLHPERFYHIVQEDYETAVMKDMRKKQLTAQTTWAKYRASIPTNRIWSNIARSHIDHSRSLMLQEIDHLRKNKGWADLRILLSEFLLREQK